VFLLTLFEGGGNTRKGAGQEKNVEHWILLLFSDTTKEGTPKSKLQPRHEECVLLKKVVAEKDTSQCECELLCCIKNHVKIFVEVL